MVLDATVATIKIASSPKIDEDKTQRNRTSAFNDLVKVELSSQNDSIEIKDVSSEESDTVFERAQENDHTPLLFESHSP